MKRNKISLRTRNLIYNKFNGRCAYCGYREKDLEIDHLVPLHLGGKDVISNMMPACHLCNRYKADKTIEEFRESLRRITENFGSKFAIAKNFGIIEERVMEIKFYFERRNNG